MIRLIDYLDKLTVLETKWHLTTVESNVEQLYGDVFNSQQIKRLARNSISYWHGERSKMAGGTKQLKFYGGLPHHQDQECATYNKRRRT